MAKWRIVLGLVVGVLFIASGAAHSLLGWKALAAELGKVSAPPDLVRGLAIGWHFGGGAMLAFGVIVLLLFLEARRNPAVSLRPALVIGVLYVVFGDAAFFLGGFNPFFVLFILPGLLLVAASWK
jgi:hypothetical protein